jgi:hypothetical protein
VTCRPVAPCSCSHTSTSSVRAVGTPCGTHSGFLALSRQVRLSTPLVCAGRHSVSGVPLLLLAASRCAVHWPVLLLMACRPCGVAVLSSVRSLLRACWLHCWTVPFSSLSRVPWVRYGLTVPRSHPWFLSSCVLGWTVPLSGLTSFSCGVTPSSFRRLYAYGGAPYSHHSG